MTFCWKESLLDIIRLGYYRYWNPVLSLSDWEYHWHSFLSLEIFVDLLRRHSNRIAMILFPQFLVYRSLIQLSSPPIQIRDNLKTLSILLSYSLRLSILKVMSYSSSTSDRQNEHTHNTHTNTS